MQVTGYDYIMFKSALRDHKAEMTPVDWEMLTNQYFENRANTAEALPEWLTNDQAELIMLEMTQHAEDEFEKNICRKALL